MQVASLRYFEAHGAFARLLRDMTGVTLPDTSARVGSTADRRSDAIILAWRSPTETLMISSAPNFIETLQGAAATMTDGCIVDQRGGALVFSAGGESVTDLFARLGGHGACPALGESLRTRLADVAVSAVEDSARGDSVDCRTQLCAAPHGGDPGQRGRSGRSLVQLSGFFTTRSARETRPHSASSLSLRPRVAVGGISLQTWSKVKISPRVEKYDCHFAEKRPRL